ncbi:hypothetical protein J6590_069188 [Homalodisca vitripennis]|nr:hypothetical protein J6590_069188 [Homalodisca vitripennis]
MNNLIACALPTCVTWCTQSPFWRGQRVVHMFSSIHLIDDMFRMMPVFVFVTDSTNTNHQQKYSLSLTHDSMEDAPRWYRTRVGPQMPKYSLLLTHDSMEDAPRWYPTRVGPQMPVFVFVNDSTNTNHQQKYSLSLTHDSMEDEPRWYRTRVGPQMPKYSLSLTHDSMEDAPRWYRTRVGPRLPVFVFVTYSTNTNHQQKYSLSFTHDSMEDAPRWYRTRVGPQLPKYSLSFTHDSMEDALRWYRTRVGPQLPKYSLSFTHDSMEDEPRWYKHASWTPDASVCVRGRPIPQTPIAKRNTRCHSLTTPWKMHPADAGVCVRERPIPQTPITNRNTRCHSPTTCLFALRILACFMHHPEIRSCDLIKQNKGESRYSTRSMVLTKSAMVTDRIRTCYL